MSKSLARKSTKSRKSATSTKPQTVGGSQEQYLRFRVLAAALAASAVRRMRADVSLLTTNGAAGAALIVDHSAEVTAALPQVSLTSVRSLDDLGAALAYADGQLERYAPPATGLKPRIARMHVLRAEMLANANTLVLAKIFAKSAVAKIRHGRGPIDGAGDCVALAALFRQHASAIAGKVTVTTADVDEAATLATQLLKDLRPAHAKRPRAKERAASIDMRDRLWTLYENTWMDHVWRAGAWLFRQDVDAYIPPLQSRVARKRVPAPPVQPPAPPAPAPVAPPVAPPAT